MISHFILELTLSESSLLINYYLYQLQYHRQTYWVKTQIPPRILLVWFSDVFQMSLRCFSDVSEMSLICFSDVGTFDIHQVLEHGSGKSHAITDVVGASVLSDKSQAVGTGTALLVDECHVVILFYVAQDQLGVVVEEIYLLEIKGMQWYSSKE